jgi:hypothetical protein
MKEVLQKVGLGDLFAYIAPGALLLCSVPLWAELPKLEGEGWWTLAAPIFLLILAYVLGLVVSTWASERGAWYILTTRGLPFMPFSWSKAWKMARVAAAWAIHWLPDLQLDASSVAALGDIQVDIYNRIGLEEGLSKIHRTPWGELALYRNMAADLLGKRAAAAREEADAMHRRFLFSQGVAAACVLLALQCLLRFLLWLMPPPWAAALLALLHLPPVQLPALPFIHPGSWALFSVLGFAVSFGLRWVAGRWWESEFALTCMLLKEVKRVEAAKAARAAARTAAAPAAAPLAPMAPASPPVAAAISHDQIAQRAYQIWVRRGCMHGRDRQDWLEAVAELRAEAVRPPTPAPPSPPGSP